MSPNLKRVTSVLITVIATVAFNGLHVAAQDVSPEASPGPVGCSVDPLPATFIADFLTTAKPDPIPTALADVPRGEPVEDATAAEIEAIITELTACTNAGDYLRAFALFDTEYLRRIIDPDGLMTAEVAAELGKTLANITPADVDEQTTVVSIDSIEQLSDGSVVAIFRTAIGTDEDDQQTDVLMFRKVGERWLIVDGLSDITV